VPKPLPLKALPFYLIPEFQNLSKDSQRVNLFKLLSWSNLKRWDFNVFSDCRSGRRKSVVVCSVGHSWISVFPVFHGHVLLCGMQTSRLINSLIIICLLISITTYFHFWNEKVIS
jgi:hypothetical protein